MPNCREDATQHGIQLRRTLPRSATIIEAFHHAPDSDNVSELVLRAANDLADHHAQQWQAEDVSRAPGASAEAVAESKRLIDALNARRVALVERIDEWASPLVSRCEEASLHTETLGSVIDRLAIAWVRKENLVNNDGDRDRARLALRQLAELADAYDDLVRDVGAGQRRLPLWRPLKTYRTTS
ncbi:DUF4254 domain-containing protein [Saccharopolyspora endophytica]|uniref:DUF4254 domain-containing protein n=1 Tax=Saccharopolyspora endophytica TaxID=543886 RepID=A0ABS5DQT9_9PSEU|nr:DUF4254 domain-containing protein [Saccharopolyspora endophytica]MBQ0928623.1 DUF4254 domain-containing protein [Saccharopolyspora endophytica]